MKRYIKRSTNASARTRGKSIMASAENISLEDVYDVISEYDGTWTNPTTGWTGKSDIYQKDLDDGSYLFSIAFTANGNGTNLSEADQILFNPNGNGRAVFTIYPYSGQISFANSISELKSALRKEYSYLKRV